MLDDGRMGWWGWGGEMVEEESEVGDGEVPVQSEKVKGGLAAQKVFLRVPEPWPGPVARRSEPPDRVRLRRLAPCRCARELANGGARVAAATAKAGGRVPRFRSRCGGSLGVGGDEAVALQYLAKRCWIREGLFEIENLVCSWGPTGERWNY